MSNKISNEASTPTNSANPQAETPVSPQILINIVKDLNSYVSIEAESILTGEESKSKEKGSSSSVEGSSRGGGSNKDPGIQIEKLKSNLGQMETCLRGLLLYEEDFKKKIEAHKKRIEDLIKNIKEMKQVSRDDGNNSSIGNRLWEINKEITKLKHRIPTTAMTSRSADHHDQSQKTEAPGTQMAVNEFLSLYDSNSFTKSSLFEEIEKVYQDLSENAQKCLLCFAVFSENEELKKKMLTYWWEGENYLTEGETIEDAAGKILESFVENHLIEPVSKNRKLTGYKMQPVIRSAIVNLAARESFFAYDAHGNLKARSPKCTCTCLVKNDSKKKELASSSNSPSQQPAKLENQKYDKHIPCSSNSPSQHAPKSEDVKREKDIEPSSNLQPQQRPKSEDQKDATSNAQPQPVTKSKDHHDEKSMDSSSNSQKKKEPESTDQNDGINWKSWETSLKTIFNVDEPFPDLRLNWLARSRDKESPTDDEKRVQVVEWLSKMNSLRVLYLGSWRTSSKHHIEADSDEFLEALKSMSSLRLLSLRGVSRITELPKSIRGLTSLRVLDLEACHNLEELPKEISYLQNLTHLDVSDCYMIDHMPRELRHLTNLQVLKGFVVGKDINALDGMKMLRKLSIITSRINFPSEKDLKTFERLEGLKKLSLSWGAAENVPNGTSSSTATPGKSRRTTCFERRDSSNNARTSKPPMPYLKSTTGKMAGTNHFKNLEKLELICFPQESTPTWLMPWKLAKLNKLYIRGGKLGGDLGYSSFKNGDGNADQSGWKSVETLCLKFLSGLKLDWEEMQEFFPKLTYLEKLDCPLITMCPCDADGVWEKLPDHEQEVHEQGGDNQKP